MGSHHRAAEDTNVAPSGSEAECHTEMFIGAGSAARFDSANVSKILASRHDNFLFDLKMGKKQVKIL